MNLLESSISASVFFLVCVVVRLLGKHRLPKNTFLVLWGVLLVKLLCPFSIDSRYSIFAWLPSLGAKEEAMLQPMTVWTFTSLPTETSEKVNVIFWLWLLGFVLVAAGALRAYWLSKKNIQDALPLERQEYLEQWLAAHPLQRQITVLYSERIFTPMTYGFWHPKIILPKTMLLQKQSVWQAVLTHEWMHIRNWDVLWKLALLTVLCLHWFNPLVWLFYYLVNRDLELRCDAQVVQALGETEKASYALALLQMSDRRCHLGPLCSGFGQKAMEERIVSIMKFKKTTMLATSLAILLVLGATTVFATSAPQDMAAEKNAGTTAEEKTEEFLNTAVADSGVNIDLSGEGSYITLEEYEDSMEEVLAELKADVAAGKISQAEMDQTMADMEQTKEELKNGDLALYQWEEGEYCYLVAIDASEDGQVNLDIQDNMDLSGQETEAK